MEHIEVDRLCLISSSDRICKRRLAAVRRSHDADAVSEFAEFQHFSQIRISVETALLHAGPRVQGR